MCLEATKLRKKEEQLRLLGRRGGAADAPKGDQGGRSRQDGKGLSEVDIGKKEKVS